MTSVQVVREVLLLGYLNRKGKVLQRTVVEEVRRWCINEL